jgi:hypothetical protein
MGAAGAAAAMTGHAGRAVVGASIANRPHRPGHAEAMLQWALGLRQLGWEVTVLDRLDAATASDSAAALHWVDTVMGDAGLAGCWAVLTGEGSPHGMEATELRRRVEGALLLDVMGFIGDHPAADAVARRVFVDVDPGYSQLWRELGYADLLAGHDRFVTVGLCVGEASCTVPTCGVPWVTTPPPVVLERWPAAPVADSAASLSTVGSWRGPWGVLDRNGVRLGQRAHTFRALLDLPARTDAGFEVMLDIDPGDAADLAGLEAAGWNVADPLEAVPTRAEYMALVHRSLAELSVAKEMYVRTGSGWFSDRSACYLASGRPVVALDTGFSHHLPTGEGLLAFADAEGAAEAVAALRAEPARHARAARAIAEEHLDAHRVLSRLLDEVAA